MVAASDVAHLLEERPDLRASLEAALQADEPWQFDEVDIDSGELGELVSRDIIRKGEDGYRVVNHDAVRNGMRGDITDRGDISDERTSQETLITIPRVSKAHQLEIALLLGSLIFVAALRLLSIPNVFVEGHVVLSSNDPYFYRYLVDQLLENPKVSPRNLPSEVSKGEPLMVVTLWLFSFALGGSKTVAGHVLAWYPVVSAIMTAILVYLLAVVLTDDKRIGLGAVLILAIIPVHAFRTSLGYADHHAFDYIWLALIVLSLAVIAKEANRETRSPTGALLTGIALLGIGVAGQTLAWDNSPILLAPLGIIVVLVGYLGVYSDESPSPHLIPISIGLAIGAVITWIGHSALSWHTTLVASSPLLLFTASLGILVVSETSHRLSINHKLLAILEVGGIAGGLLLLSRFFPNYWSRLVTGVSQRLLAQRGIAEVQGIFGDSLGWLLLFGFTLLLGLPYLGWATNRARFEAKWVGPISFGWYFLILSAVQGRFAGELGVILTPFAGMGLVHIADRIGVARVPGPLSEVNVSQISLPEPKQVVTLVLLFLLVGSLSWIQIPVKINQISTPVEQSKTAFWIAEYSDQHDMEYPENYVLSRWDNNRMFNYFVNGESLSYSFARDNYGKLTETSSRENSRYTLERRVGFVVVTKSNGARQSPHFDKQQYELIYSSSSGRYTVFRLSSQSDF